MKSILQVIFILVTILSAQAYASKNNFQFQIDQYHTTRQSGQTLDVNVRYAMKDNVSYDQYPDYRELRKIALKYLEPTADLPINTY